MVMAAAPRPGSNQPPRTTAAMNLATSEEVTYYYPNRMGRIVLIAMEEVLGRHGVNAVCNLGKLHHLFARIRIIASHQHIAIIKMTFIRL